MATPTVASLTKKLEKLEDKLFDTEDRLRVANIYLKDMRALLRSREADLRKSYKENEKLAKRIHQLDNGAK